jgi:hypothetical protein
MQIFECKTNVLQFGVSPGFGFLLTPYCTLTCSYQPSPISILTFFKLTPKKLRRLPSDVHVLRHFKNCIGDAVRVITERQCTPTDSSA